jgi:SNF2 family DNA or RNA helicase
MVRLLQAASNPTLLYQYSQEFEIPPISSDGTTLVELIEKYPNFEIPVKFEAAVELIKKLIKENKKVVLWTTFIHNIEMLKDKLKSIKYFTVYGAIPRDDNENEIFNREKEIREFKLSKEPCLLIANPAACAESISLHKYCHDAIYLDRTFNCGQYIQSMDRLHRIGLDQNEIVNYYILIAKDTIDETIDQRLDEKFETMIHVLEDEIPIGDLDIEGPELENEDEEAADFEATVNDVRKFLKSK